MEDQEDVTVEVVEPEPDPSPSDKPQRASRVKRDPVAKSGMTPAEIEGRRLDHERRVKQGRKR